MSDKIVITTGARLHFGFLAHRPSVRESASPASLHPSSGLLATRNYGGAGLMIDSPSFVVVTSPSDNDQIAVSERPTDSHPWAYSIAAARALVESTRRRVADFVAAYRETGPPDRRPPPCRVDVGPTIAPHHGLGSGTQLGMAVAKALALLSGDLRADPRELARRVGRGKRSAVGVHGFAQGGFLVDAGKKSGEEIAPLAARADVPADWRFLLIMPAKSAGTGKTGLSGQAEVDALERLPEMPERLTDRLCRVVLLEMIPALADADIERFGEALFEFGRFVGEYFQPVQGGQYADPKMADLVRWLRTQGVRGVAQTSWGPTIASCCPDDASAESLRQRILSDGRWSDCGTHMARPLNSAAKIER